MSPRSTMLTNLLLCLPLTAGAVENFTTLPTPAIVNSDNSKKAWMDNIEQSLPGLLCDRNQYFVQCFKVSEHECVAFTKLLVHACLSNVALALPQTVDSQQGEYWGQMIGRCSYDLYNKHMEAKKRHTPSCSAKPSQALP